MMNSDQLRAIWESAFNLDLGNHFGDPVHHLISAQELPPQIHQFRYSPAIADKFEQLSCNECDALRLVELQATREAFLSEETRLVQ